jgi:hypothetical protein
MALQEPKLSFNHELHFSSKDRRQYLCMFCYSMLIQALSSKKSFSHYSQVAYIPRKYEPENDCLLCALILERPQETEKLSHSRIINHEEGELIILANPQREAPLQSLRVVYLALGELPSYELGSRDTLSQTERIMMNSMNAYSAIDRRQLEPQRVRSLDAQIRISTDHSECTDPPSP